MAVFTMWFMQRWGKQLNKPTQYCKKNNFLIGYRRGSKMAAELLADLPAKNKFALDFPGQAFRMLSSSRINAYLADPGVVNRAILRKLKNDVPNNYELQEIE